MARPKIRLDELLLKRELVANLREARGLIVAGKVVVDDARVESKPGVRVPDDTPVHVRGGPKKFVSRGGLKLDRALSAFQLSVDGLVALDAGASTGGFTDCLLQRRARHVYAVDVGYGQFHSRLALDPRVTSLERTNVGDLSPDTFEEPPGFCSADLSYLSLVTAVPILEPLLHPSAHLVCLVKPMYEGLGQEEADDPAALERVLRAVLDRLGPVATRSVAGVACSPIRGSRDAVEFLLWLSPEGRTPREHTVEAALAGAKGTFDLG